MTARRIIPVISMPFAACKTQVQAGLAQRYPALKRLLIGKR